jgi:DNA-binding LytR/AlgR family response regulator
VEVKIGVQFAPRELVLESTQSQEDVEKAVSEALSSPLGLLSLADEKGRRVLVPTDKIAYVEIAESEVRRVGFGTA